VEGMAVAHTTTCKKMPVTTGDCSNIAGEAASYFDMVISAIS
jgi:phycoerythrin beta chain